MTQDEIHHLFVYEPATGMLRKVTNSRSEYPWRGIGKGKRYLAYSHGKTSIYLHQAVWLYHFGYVPAMIDHINNDHMDNRIENLRECTNAQNQYNSPMKSNNRSGYKGIVFHQKCKSKPWQAKIVVQGRVISLGYHATKEGAAEAYGVGATKYAGDFARTN